MPAMAIRRPPPERALLLRAVRWTKLPGHRHTLAEACAKFGIGASALRKASRELAAEAAIGSDEDVVLAALHPSGPKSVASVVAFYDWVNHAVLERSEAIAILERLVARGLVRRVGERYELAVEWP